MFQDYPDDLLGDPQNIEEIVDDERDEALFLEDDENDARERDQDGNEGEPSLQTDPTGTPVDPKKKRTVQRPQPRLNPERLMGPRGIATLETVFKDFKFLGKDHEKEDLNQLMKWLEHWAHRLYPRFQFDDCLDKIETLGHKKPVMTYIKKIRMGMVTADEPLILPDEVDDQPTFDVPPIDEFDALITQQLTQIQTNTPVPPSPVPSQPSTTLTAEQKERMLRNRLLAEERRLARMKAQQERERGTEEASPHSIMPVCSSTSGVLQDATITEESSDVNTLDSI